MPSVKVPGVMVIEDSMAAVSKVERARSGNSMIDGDTSRPGVSTSRANFIDCTGTCQASHTR